MIKNKYSFAEIGAKKTAGKENDAVLFTIKEQLMKKDVWRSFVDAFKSDCDADDNGWRGEYWGKMMRGACLTYIYSNDKKLYAVLENTVKEMLGARRANGTFNTYGEKEFNGWDMWSRKYIITSFIHFYGICKDEALKKDILDAMTTHIDYILEKVGPESEGKIEITNTSISWLGLNSASILEPIVEFYKLTGKKKYLDFAKYIISGGGSREANLIDLLMKEGLYPYQFPVVKAYEMISFFEGLIAFYEATGDKYYLEVAERFGDAVEKSDITVIGCAGCTHEKFDNSAITQAQDQNGICQETCVTVTWMRYNARLYMLTGNTKYMDRFYISAYNGLLGAINEHGLDQWDIHNKILRKGLPFDSYSPIYDSPRGSGIGGFKILTDGSYYGCCACIASAGTALFPLMQALKGENSIVITSPFTGELKTALGDNKIKIASESRFPKAIYTKFKITSDEKFEFLIRKLSFAENISFKLNGKKFEIPEKDGYYLIERKWSKGDELLMSGDIFMKALTIGKRTSLSYGVLCLANDEMKNKNFKKIRLTKSFTYEKMPASKAYGEQIRFKITTHSKKEFILTDYASCGKHWDKKKNNVSVWFD